MNQICKDIGSYGLVPVIKIDDPEKAVPLAKALRKNMTLWERKLWYNFLKNYAVRFQSDMIYQQLV